MSSGQPGISLKRVHRWHLMGAVALTVFAVGLLAAGWKFLVEEWLDPFLPGAHQIDSEGERWEFVILSALFAALALVIPAVTIFRLLRDSLAARLLAETVFIRAPQPMVVTGPRHEVRALNSAWSRFFGMASDQLLGKPLTSVPPVSSSEPQLRRAIEALRKSGRWAGEINGTKGDGTEYSCWVSVTSIRDFSDEGDQHVWVFTDITARKSMEAEAWRTAMHDELTGLPNRRMLLGKIDQALRLTAASPPKIALLYIDLDGFKQINDAHGHSTGDSVLREVAARIRRLARSEDTVARLGGDEFVILLQAFSDENDVMKIASRCIDTVSIPVEFPGISARVGASIGIFVSQDVPQSAEDVLTSADRAMYKAKRGGRGRWVMAQPDEAIMGNRSSRHADEVSSLL